jgi:hypothetical protein
MFFGIFPTLLGRAGEGRVHDCLRSNRDHLSDACRKEELLLEELVSGLRKRESNSYRPTRKQDIKAGQERQASPQPRDTRQGRLLLWLPSNAASLDSRH